MRARIRKTGEIVDVICYAGVPKSRNSLVDYVNYIDSQGVEHTEPNHLNYYWDFEPIETTNNDETAELELYDQWGYESPLQDYWQEVRERAAIAAMQGIMNFFDDLEYKYSTKTIAKVAKLAVKQADALIKELKKK